MSCLLSPLQYIYLTRMALNVFNCVPTSPPDGNTYMAGLLQYPCGGDTQKALIFPAICAFVGYSIAVPGVALWFLRAKVRCCQELTWMNSFLVYFFCALRCLACSATL
jgi:hypothetical protein